MNFTLRELEVVGHYINGTLMGLTDEVTDVMLATPAVSDDVNSTTESTSTDYARSLKVTSEEIIDCLKRGTGLFLEGYMSGVISLSANGSDPTGGETFLSCDVIISVPVGMFFIIRFFETEAEDGFFKPSVFEKQFGVSIRDEQRATLCLECLKSPPMVVYSRTDRVRVQIKVIHFDRAFSLGFNFTAVSSPVVPQLEVVFLSATQGQC